MSERAIAAAVRLQGVLGGSYNPDGYVELTAGDQVALCDACASAALAPDDAGRVAALRAGAAALRSDRTVAIRKGDAAFLASAALRGQTADVRPAPAESDE